MSDVLRPPTSLSLCCEQVVRVTPLAPAVSHEQGHTQWWLGRCPGCLASKPFLPLSLLLPAQCSLCEMPPAPGGTASGPRRLVCVSGQMPSCRARGQGLVSQLCVPSHLGRT